MIRKATTLLVLLLAACGGDDPAAPADSALEPMDLARVGTIGWSASDLPGSVAILDIHREGRMVLDGKEIADYLALSRALTPLADADRDEDLEAHPSRLHFVVRCDRDAPWRAVQWALQAAGDPENRILRTLFGVLPIEGDEEGTLAIYLPMDRGLAKAFSGRGRMQTQWTLRLVAGEGPAADPDALAAHFGDGKDPAAVLIMTDGDVPAGLVLRTADVLFRSGVTRLSLGGTMPPEAGVGVPPAPSETPPISIRLGEAVLPAGDAPSPPRPERVDGLAGWADFYEGLDPVIEEIVPLEEGDLPFEEPK